MSEAAVIDAPETTETKGAPPAETKDVEPNVTDGAEAKLQTDAEATPEDHAAELDREKAEAEEARLQQLAEQKAQDLERQKERQARETARKEKVRSARQTAVTKFGSLADQVDAVLKTLPEPSSVNRKSFTDVIEALNLDIEEAKSEEVAESYRAAFDAGLGEAAADFWKAAEELAGEDGATPVSALLDLYAERKAAASKWAKELTLDEAKKASPKLRLEVTNALKAEYEKGRENPLPAGEPRGGDGASASGRVSYGTKREARNLHAQGKITDAEMRVVNHNPNIPDGY